MQCRRFQDLRYREHSRRELMDPREILNEHKLAPKPIRLIDRIWILEQFTTAEQCA